MAKVVYAARALADLERVAEFLLENEPELAEPALERIAEAVSMLHEHPLIGRPVEYGLRELVISRGRTGYLALYDYREQEEVVLVLAIRHQREGGFDATSD